jgi:cold shock CspA family protein
MRGRVDRLVPAEGYGLLIAENGQELCFHRSALEGVDWEEIAPGTTLEFDVKAHATGDEPGEHSRAVSVRLAPNAVPAADHEALPAEKLG